VLDFDAKNPNSMNLLLDLENQTRGVVSSYKEPFEVGRH
jgi:hypothetical protein